MSKTLKANKVNVVANADTTNANNNVSFELQEYTKEVLDTFDAEKFCRSISANVMLMKLLNSITNTNETFEHYVAYALSKTYNISNLKAEDLTRNNNLKHVILARITAKTETANADTKDSFTLEEIQDFYNENRQKYTKKQVFDSLAKHKVSKALIDKIVLLSEDVEKKTKLSMQIAFLFFFKKSRTKKIERVNNMINFSKDDREEQQEQVNETFDLFENTDIVFNQIKRVTK